MTGDFIPEGTNFNRDSILHVGARSPIEDRLLTNWPLEDCPLDVQLSLDDFTPGRQYPPSRAKKRQDRLDSYERLYRGDVSDYVKDAGAGRLMVNYFGRICEVMSALLVSTNPDDLVINQLQHSLVDMIRYGRSYCISIDEEIKAADPRHSWIASDQEDTIYVVDRYLSPASDDGMLDRAVVYAINESGYSAWDAELKNGVWGERSEEEAAGSGNWALMDRPPVLEQWGSSSFDSIIPLVVGIALRLTGVEHVLTAHEDPVLIISGSKLDVNKLYPGVDASVASQLGDTAFQRAARGYLENNVIAQPQGIQKPEYVTWDGSLAASFMSIDTMKRELRMMTGLVSALEQEAGDAPSGVALREEYRVLGWTAGRLHPVVHTAYQEVWKPFEWPSAFDEGGISEEPLTPQDEALIAEIEREALEAGGEGAEVIATATGG